MVFKKYIPAFIWATVILILTLTPGQFLPKVNYWSINSLDKYVHFFIFFIEAYLLFLGNDEKSIISYKNFIVLLIIGIVFGGIIELIQAFIPHRSCDLNDLIANSIGCMFGAISYLFINKSKFANG